MLRAFACSSVVLAVVAVTASAPALSSDLVSVLPLTDRVLLLHFDDGHVQHHQRGQKRSDERVLVDRLEIAAATTANNYRISSTNDAAYTRPQQPTEVGRKTKGTD